MHCIYCRERKRQVPGPKYTPRQKSCVHRLTQGLTLFLTHNTSFVFCSSSHGASTYLKALVCAVMCCNPLFSKALGMYCLSRPLRPLSRPLVPCLQTLRSTPWFTALCLGTCHVSEQFSHRLPAHAWAVQDRARVHDSDDCLNSITQAAQAVLIV